VGSTPRVKICGLVHLEDARFAAEVGASYLGAILVPGSPREVTPERAGELRETGGGVPLVIVTADRTLQELVALARGSGADAIQLHGSESAELVHELRAEGPWELWKAVRVRSGEEILRAVDLYERVVDLLLLDAWDPVRLGGTGHSFPWPALEEVRSRLPPNLRLGVAGGLTPENVAEAVRRLTPELVDVSSGVEAEPGRKDLGRVRRFIVAAHSGQAP